MKPWRLLALVAGSVLAGGICSLSCSQDKKPTQPACCDPDSLITQANASLEQVLFDQANGPGPTRPSDIDFSAPTLLYQQALQASPDNKTAHFGVALTNLLALTVDPEVNAAFDDWKAYLDTRVPFEVGPQPSGFLGISLGFPRGGTAFRLPFDLVPLTALAQMRTLQLPTDPQVEEVQRIFLDHVIPGLANAQSHLAQVAADPGFAFRVTGRMQGDEEADYREIDRTDILAMRAACDLLLAACRMAVSYQVGFAAYDSLNLVQGLSQGGGWLALRGTGGQLGRTQMPLAHADLLTAIDDLDAGITSLLNEGEPQDHDVIRIGPDQVARADVESVRVNLPHVRQGLSGGYAVTADWDGDSDTPDTPLTINAGALLTDPVPDWKSLLPPYTIRVERRVWDDHSEIASLTSRITVTAPAAGSYSASYWMNVDEGGEGYYGYGPDWLTTPLRNLMRAQYQATSALPGWSGWFYASIFVDRSFAAGTQQIDVPWSFDYGLADRSVFVPVMVWDAERYADWQWPDPTMHGLLPGILSSSQLMATFGGRADRWQREWPLDWTQAELDLPTAAAAPRMNEVSAGVWSTRSR